MVGEWKTEMTVNGVKTGSATHKRTWDPGRYCLRMSWESEENGVPVNALGISGWNPETKEVVEHWYDSLGRYGSVQYPLEKMTKDAWEGTARRVLPDGKINEGTCRLEKGDGRWVFSISGQEDGQAMTVKNFTLKVD